MLNTKTVRLPRYLFIVAESFISVSCYSLKDPEVRGATFIVYGETLGQNRNKPNPNTKAVEVTFRRGTKIQAGANIYIGTPLTQQLSLR